MPLQILPRYIRVSDAPGYLAMDRNRFNSEVRPYLTEISIGTQGKAFDRLDLEAFADEYKSRNGRPGRQYGDQLWDKQNYRVCKKEAVLGISIKSSTEGGFEKAVEQVHLKKPMP